MNAGDPEISIIRAIIWSWSSFSLSLSLCSFKFGRKINYVSYLSELEDVVKCEQLIIPARVKEWELLMEIIHNRHFHLIPFYSPCVRLVKHLGPSHSPLLQSHIVSVSGTTTSWERLWNQPPSLPCLLLAALPCPTRCLVCHLHCKSLNLCWSVWGAL